MAMRNCDFCNSPIDLDWVEGEWDIENNEGDHFDFVCSDCFCGNDEFKEPEVKRKTTEQIIQSMEKQVNSPEWKRLKENNNGSTTN